ncbi:alanine--glyoxylate aminotransferase-like isoform X2 [Corticium candelabrum]|uniref:alanine--glyoxylate aminotransferase-like isoform X2 n=1 Tax=Corticium candelabrum TaxID=121492 RepID=UPI002E25BB60|nr:alanine--glyoxylate aminotransferase-like isoform X2 [Corticium candelabrum]
MTELSRPPLKLFDPLHVPTVTLMGSGPTNCSPRVMAALTHQMSSPTVNACTMAVSGAGHAAMECALTSLIEPGDVVLVTVHGIWGERASDIATRQGGIVKTLNKEIGEVFSLSDLEEGLKEHKPRVMFVTHAESSGGTLQPLKDIGPLCHRYGCLLVVDAVASLGAVPLFTDAWEIDVLYSASQKVLSAPSGISPITFSRRAWKKVEQRKTRIRSFYLDATLLAHYWGVEQPLQYHHTGLPVNLYGMREALAEICEEGLQAIWERHQVNSELLWTGLENLGLKFLVPDKEYRLGTITAVILPSDVDSQAVIAYVKAKHNLEISPGLGPSKGKIWRIGLMGYNCKLHNVHLALKALKDAFDNIPKQE